MKRLLYIILRRDTRRNTYRIQKIALIKKIEIKFQIVFDANEYRNHEIFNFTRKKIVLIDFIKKIVKTVVLILITRLINYCELRVSSIIYI